MERVDRFITLDARHLSRYSGDELADLMQYLSPSLLLLTGEMSPRRRRWIEERASVPVLSVARPGSASLGSRDVVVVPSLDEVASPDLASRSEPLCIVTSTVSETVDPHSMSVRWEGLDAYRQFADRLPASTNHLAPNVPAGDPVPSQQFRRPLLRGAGCVEQRFDLAVPCLRVGRKQGVFVEEVVSSSAVGMRAIPGVGREKRRVLARAGYRSREDLLESDPESLMELEGIGPYYACVLLAGARAMQECTPVWFDKDPLCGHEIVYVDIETDTAGSVSNIWQIGAYDEATERYRYFLQTRDPGDPRAVPRQFARWVHEEVPDRTFVAWYGSRFDFHWLDQFVQKYAEPEHRQSWLESRRVDLLEDVVRPRLRLPVRSHGLDVVARRMGFERRHEGLDGADAARAYARWMSGEEPDWDRWIAYCRDDVMAMKHLYERLRSAPRPLDVTAAKQRYRRRAVTGS